MRSLALACLLCTVACSSPEPPIDDVDAGAPGTEPEPEPPLPDPDDDPAEPPWHDAVITLGNNGGGFRPAEVSYGGAARVALDVTATPGAEPFEVHGVAYALHRAGRNNVFFRVRNVGTDVRCFIELGEITFRDATGTPLAEDGGQSAFVLGSVRRLASITTATCLAPGETAWAVYLSELTSTQLFAARAVAITLRSVVAAADASEPAARVVPTRMQLTRTDVRVELVNQGSGPAKLETTEWLAFDRTGRPLGWGYLLGPTQSLAAGASTVATQWPSHPLDLDLFSPVVGTVATTIVRVTYDDVR